MCGIAGFWNPKGLDSDAPEVVKRMTDAIRHRGPDGEGFWLDPEAGIALGHRRLAILDLSPAGAQPMVSPSGRYVMTYNGEIYNWRELRTQEEGHGARWRGHSDTEVFLALCDRVGVRQAVCQSKGMFALAVWDREDRTLTLVRDRVGEKPLYYGWCNGTLLFGSELKALRSHPRFIGEIDRVALTQFMRHNYVPGPRSIFTGLQKLVPGTMAVIRPTGQQVADPYWSLAEVFEAGERERFAGPDEEASAHVEAVLRTAVRQQMISDVPLGAFLSGGIDSSLITALMQAESSTPVKTFSIGFDEARFDEARHAKAVAGHLGTEHTELYVTAGQALEVIPSLPEIWDEPFADSSQIPTYLVSSMTRHGVTVALSGDGGDEVFGGYERYRFTNGVWGRLVGVPQGIRVAAGRAMLSLPVSALDALLVLPGRFSSTRLDGDRVHKFANLVGSSSLQALYKGLVSHWEQPTEVVIDGSEDTSSLDAFAGRASDDPLRHMMFVDSVTYLPDDIQVKVDRAAMAVGLECRAPFLHPDVIGLAATLPSHLLHSHGQGKRVLRQCLARHVPPKLWDRPKSGFAIPLGEWMRGPLREWVSDLLSPQHLKAAGLFHVEPIQKKIAEHMQGRRSWQYHLWDACVAMAWYESASSGRTRVQG